jgi:hypothetical protein
MVRAAVALVFLAWIGGCRDVDTVLDDGDGSTSASASSASSSSAASSTGASMDTGTYSAINLVTGAPRFALMKRDDTRNLCFQIVVVASAGSALEWEGPTSVDLARVTHDAHDCAPWTGVMPPPAMGEILDATGLTGTLVVSAPPCFVDVDATLSFTNPPSWAPDMEPLTAEDLVIDGGCP